MVPVHSDDALRGIGDPIELMATASELLGRAWRRASHLRRHDETGEHATVSRDRNDGAIPDMLRSTGSKISERPLSQTLNKLDPPL